MGEHTANIYMAGGEKSDSVVFSSCQGIYFYQYCPTNNFGTGVQKGSQPHSPKDCQPELLKHLASCVQIYGDPDHNHFGYVLKLVTVGYMMKLGQVTEP